MHQASARAPKDQMASCDSFVKLVSPPFREDKSRLPWSTSAARDKRIAPIFLRRTRLLGAIGELRSVSHGAGQFRKAVSVPTCPMLVFPMISNLSLFERWPETLRQ